MQINLCFFTIQEENSLFNIGEIMSVKKIFLLFLLINLIISTLACNNLISPRETTDSIKEVTPTKKIETTTNKNENTNQGKQFVRLWSDPATLDPHLSTDATSANIIVEIFGGLVTINPDMEIVPDIATRWDIENNGLSYIFHLNNLLIFLNSPLDHHRKIASSLYY